MKVRVSLLVVLVALLFSWGAFRQVAASGKCTGQAYEGHPALVWECLHMQSVKSDDNVPYPPPSGWNPTPYPEPGDSTQPLPTSAPRPFPTEPPLPTDVP